MTKETKTYTKEVEAEENYWVCDGPGDDGDGCDEEWETMRDFGRDANIITANPWTPRKGLKAEMPYFDEEEGDNGYFLTSEDEFARSRGHADLPPVMNDAEMHLCDGCYEKVKPLFGLEVDDEEDKESVWERVVDLFK